MYKFLPRLGLIFGGFLSLFVLFVPPALSQSFDTSFGVANYLPIAQDNVQDGAIIVSRDGQYQLGNREYDPQMIGVVTENAAIVFKIEGGDQTPVVANGNAFVLVSAKNGTIKRGDLVT
ncbi:MAG TPA: hypothetical protein PLD54_05000, partial [Candidatus Levybacteria bacterium]|nr:hypothetical protein [Candidatus Levybacteria bacterium]